MARMEWLEYIGNKMIQGRETLKFIKGCDVLLELDQKLQRFEVNYNTDP